MASIADVGNLDPQQLASLLFYSVSEHFDKLFSHLCTSSDIDYGIRNENEMTLLTWAVICGNELVVDQLLLKGVVDINTRDEAGMTPISWAAKIGYTQILKRLLPIDRAEINSVDNTGMTSLLWAIRNGHEESVSAFLERRDPTLNRKDRLLGRTPVIWAIIENEIEILSMLLSSNQYFTLNAADKEGKTALIYAGEAGNLDVITKLLEQGARMDSKLLMIALEKEDESLVELALSKGAYTEIEITDQKERPLHIAARKGNSKLIDLLLDWGANIEAELPITRSVPLHVAAKHGSDAAVRTLIDRGANLRATTNLQQRPIHLAVEHGHLEILKLLLDAGADATATAYGVGGAQAFHLAVENGHLSIIEWMLNNGFDIESRMPTGTGALHIAARQGHTEVVKLLLERGANVMSGQFVKPLHTAVFREEPEVAELLLKAGADINATSSLLCRNTALHLAVQTGNKGLVELLLNNRANPHIRNGVGLRAVDIAMEDGRDEIVPMFSLSVSEAEGFDSVFREAETAILENEDSAALDQLLALRTMDINWRGPGDRTLLHVAASSGKLNIASFLLSKGAHLDAVTSVDCISIIGSAIDHEDLDMMEFLLSAGARLDQKNLAKAIDCAVRLEDMSRVLLLVKSDCDSGPNGGTLALHSAVRENKRKILQSLLKEEGINLDCVLDGKTPLSQAIDLEDLDLISLLIDHGANIELRTSEKSCTPIESILLRDDILNGLLSTSNSLESRLRKPEHLLFVAKSGTVSSLRILLQLGLNPNEISLVQNTTPLHTAAERGSTELVRFLLESGADASFRMLVATKDDLQNPQPLDLAVKKGHLDVIQLLVAHGAEINCEWNELYGFPLHSAVRSGRREVVKLLLGLGARVGVMGGPHQQTPLHIAAGLGRIRLMKILIQNGAVIDERDAEGLSPLDYANYMGHVRTAQLLRDHGAVEESRGVGEVGSKSEWQMVNGNR